MIVNPQLFNYRLIISSLLVVLTVLGVFSFSNYKSVESYEAFLKQEKSLIENELAEMVLSYDELTDDYDFLDSQLVEAKLQTQNALDSLRLMKSNLSVINQFKNYLTSLRSRSKELLTTIDSLNIENLKLEQEKHEALNTLQNKTKVINALEQTNDVLSKTIDNASILRGSNVRAQAYKLRSGKKLYTEKAKRATKIEVCITLTENPLTEKGEKDIYIQILSPEGNVISDKGEIKFGEASLNFSKKEVVSYNNENLDLCTTIIAEDKNQPFSKGHYFINVFYKNIKLGGTSLHLK